MSDEAETQEAAAPPDDRPLYVIDPDEDARLGATELQEELGRAVSAMDPSAFGESLFADLSDAVAIVIEWDLEGRLGLDLLEAIRLDPRTREVAVLLAAEAPTRPMVSAALRLGARGFVRKPYELDELRSCVGAITGADASAAPVAD